MIDYILKWGGYCDDSCVILSVVDEIQQSGRWNWISAFSYKRRAGNNFDKGLSKI